MFPEIEIDRPCPRIHSRVGGGGAGDSPEYVRSCVYGGGYMGGGGQHS
jgi:hypothetical protein